MLDYSKVAPQPSLTLEQLEISLRANVPFNASVLAVSSGKSCEHGAAPHVSNAHITSCLWT